MLRTLLAAAAVVSLLHAAPARAAILPDATRLPPTMLDVTAAVAVTPHGSVRWTRLSVTAPSASAAGIRVLWLVPARPGAAVDWAPDAWLDALDDATAVRIVAPASPPPCAAHYATVADRAPAWERRGVRRLEPAAITVLPTEASLREHAGGHGFTAAPDVLPRIGALYARGYLLLAVELEIVGAMTTPTLRVSDDGEAVLPFALEGAVGDGSHVTVFTLGDGPVTIERAGALDPASLTWNTRGSSFGEARRAILATAPWIRTSSAHEPLFAGLAGVRSIVHRYFATEPSCERAAAAAGARAGTTGRACAGGAAVRVGGGTACAPSEGTIDVAAFACGRSDDLALALGGTSPANTFVTRFEGRIAPGSFGADEPLVSGAVALSPIVRATTYDRCPEPPRAGELEAPPQRAPTQGTASAAEEPAREVDDGEGCGSSGGGDEAAAEGCALLISAAADDDASSDDDDDATDEDDDATDEDVGDDEPYDEPAPDDASSEDDDDANGAAPKRHARTRPRIERRSSPVSRCALLFGAIVLPFRRRRRVR